MAEEIISRSEAKARGLKHYFTGKPCKHGHIAKRYIGCSRCLGCHQSTDAEYLRDYRIKNADRLKEKRDAQYRVPENRQKRLLKQKAWYRKRAEDREIALRMATGLIRPKTCDICGDRRKIHFDHCHATGKFRGWLCMPCNVILGLAKDNPERLRKLADYLEQHQGICDGATLPATEQGGDDRNDLVGTGGSS